MSLRVRPVLGTMTLNDRKQMQQALDLFIADAAAHGEPRPELDTALLYSNGKIEALLGELGIGLCDPPWIIATKANPWGKSLLGAKGLPSQLKKSLKSLGTAWVAIFYLHGPDDKTPIEETLKAAHNLYKAGAFGQFGLSNFSAAQVDEICALCAARGWVPPTVYQGAHRTVFTNAPQINLSNSP